MHHLLTECETEYELFENSTARMSKDRLSDFAKVRGTATYCKNSGREELLESMNLYPKERQINGDEAD